MWCVQNNVRPASLQQLGTRGLIRRGKKEMTARKRGPEKGWGGGDFAGELGNIFLDRGLCKKDPYGKKGPIRGFGGGWVSALVPGR